MSASPLRIAIDCRAITASKTGDRAYLLNLIRALPRLEPEALFLFYTPEPSPETRLDYPNVEPVVLPADPPWTWAPYHFPDDLARAEASLAHVQYPGPPRAPCPVVLMLHDIAFRRHWRLLPPRQAALLNLAAPLALRRAARIITPSEATRREVLRCYRLPAERVVVVPAGAGPACGAPDRDRARERMARAFRLRGPYVLAVGAAQPGANLARLVRAFRRVTGEFPHQLVIVGREDRAAEALQRALAETRLARRVTFTGYVADADLRALYAGADLFAHPALWDGAGLPVLEALSCGTPVLAARIPSLLEVAGEEAARWVEPESSAGIGAALRELLGDPAAGERLAAAGRARAREFTWEETARRTLAVYRDVLGR